jgi:hypothetical protein
LVFSIGYFPNWKIRFSSSESSSFLFGAKKENIISLFVAYLKNNSLLCGKYNFTL